MKIKLLDEGIVPAWLDLHYLQVFAGLGGKRWLIKHRSGLFCAKTTGGKHFVELFLGFLELEVCRLNQTSQRQSPAFGTFGTLGALRQGWSPVVFEVSDPTLGWNKQPACFAKLFFCHSYWVFYPKPCHEARGVALRRLSPGLHERSSSGPGG